MPDHQALIAHLYAAFNQRDIDAAFALMTDNIDWPKASEGGRVVGKDAIRDYWTRQWSTFDPRVDPLEVLERADGKTAVKVHQVVKDLAGNLLSDATIWHIYLIDGSLIQRMEIEDGVTHWQTLPSHT